MPTSKKRKPTRTAVQDRPRPPVKPEDALQVATLALTEAGLQLVQESEVRIRREVRMGGNVEEALQVHHFLRSGVLGLLTAYSKLAGMPDPREGKGNYED